MPPETNQNIKIQKYRYTIKTSKDVKPKHQIVHGQIDVKFLKVLLVYKPLLIRTNLRLQETKALELLLTQKHLSHTLENGITIQMKEKVYA